MSSEEDNLDDGLGNNSRYKEKQRKDLRLNYDSDSSSEEEDVPKKDDDDDDDDDMFASDDEKIKEKKNKVELLDMDKFERDEELEGVSGAHEESYDSDDSDSDSNNYYIQSENLDYHEMKSKKEPKLEAFNLRDDLEEGDFDAGGNFIRKKQEESINDESWLDVKKSDIKKAKLAKDKREAKKTEVRTILPTGELLRKIIEILEPSESPMEALARFAPKKRTNVKKNKKLDVESEDKLANETRRSQVLAITELCDDLIDEKHIIDTYDLSREELMRKYKVETGDEYNAYSENRGTKRVLDENEEEQDYYGEKIWEFRWFNSPDINGPFSNYEMKHWKETYFNGQVEVRRAGEVEFLNVNNCEFE